MKIAYVIGAVICAAAIISVAALNATACRPTGISEFYFNLIDDDCDGSVDEDYARTVCGNGVMEQGEFCDDGNLVNLDGCSSDCKVESEDTIYVAPYMGNIDGGYSEDWYYVFDRITEFYDKNGIPAGFSIYPSSIHGEAFAGRFVRMYNSPYIEFVQKGDLGDEEEQWMDRMTSEEVNNIIRQGREDFRNAAEQILGTSSVTVPVAYNQPQGRFNVIMRDALESQGFHIFFEMYKNDDLDAVMSTPNFDVTQYGAGFAVNGEAGRGTVYRQPDDIIDEIKNFDRMDVNVLHVQGRKIVPIWDHQSDFESATVDNAIDDEKWRIFTTTMLRIKQDPNLVLVSPSQIYDMRH